MLAAQNPTFHFPLFLPSSAASPASRRQIIGVLYDALRDTVSEVSPAALYRTLITENATTDTYGERNSAQIQPI